jgi:hypothetical protein
VNGPVALAAMSGLGRPASGQNEMKLTIKKDKRNIMQLSKLFMLSAAALLSATPSKSTCARFWRCLLTWKLKQNRIERITIRLDTLVTCVAALLLGARPFESRARIWQKKAAKNDMKTTIQAVVRAPNLSVHTLKGFALVLALGAAVQGVAGQLK